ncbi:MAG TPA: alcohol dehydrogenase catalytic domain-containing protein [Pseudonocardiaceae bacterium]|jgi:2-desacetyl-2-hydroxyethyl bacteriochlorophyllide A dehydrogenase|nr:alcohol dehydrogenase catalytic domain-containing protein [Pseudonocardiaceae bacterium]
MQHSTLPATASAVLVTEPGSYQLTEVPVRAPEADEVLVEVVAAGICGSDVELFAGTRPAEIVSYPIVPGHEWAGLIAATGTAVTTLTAGEPVVVEGFRWCGKCARCLEGATNLCLSGYHETGFTEPGAFSRFVTVPARLVHPLPADADVEAAALIEPAACIAAAVLTGRPRDGDRFVVVGSGTLGLIAVQMLAAHRPAELILVGNRPNRHELAERFHAGEALTSAEFASRIESGGVAADLVIEAAGSPGAAASAVRAARKGGTVVLTGIPGVPADPLDPTDITVRELHVHGVFGAHTGAWSEAVSRFAAGQLDLNALVSHRFPLTEFGQAMETVRAHAPGTGKVLVLPEREA